MIFKPSKNRPLLTLQASVKFLAIVTIITASYAQAAEAFVVNLSGVKAEKVTMGVLVERSEGHIVFADNKYQLKSAVTLTSDIPVELSQELLVGPWNLKVESPAVIFNNFSVKSFEPLAVEKNPQASGSLSFVTHVNTSGVELPLRVSGNMSAILRGQNTEHGGSVDLPANARFQLKIAYDLRGGDLGGKDGVLTYKINDTSDYAYEPEGIESISLSDNEIDNALKS